MRKIVLTGFLVLKCLVILNFCHAKTVPEGLDYSVEERSVTITAKCQLITKPSKQTIISK